ncbi:MAG: TetR/AcrR family transcriptional regulator [Gemmatimonadaceae bacterium]
MADDTRDRILFSAMTLFAEKGYASTSVSDILHAAKANAGSLYYFFPGKQDVLIAVLETYLAGIQPMLLEPAWRGIDDPIKRVFALLDRYRLALTSTDHTYGCPIGSIALEIHEPDPTVRKLLAANFDGWVNAIEKCFVDAGKRLPKTLDRRSLAVFTLTTMEGGVMLSRTQRSIKPFDDSVKMLTDYVDVLASSARSAVGDTTDRIDTLLVPSF